MRMLVLGAAGFLGQRVVGQALERGHRVRAVVRPGRDISGLAWAGNEHVDVEQVDLASASVERFGSLLADADVVIHAAGALHGDDAVHRVETIEPTRRLLHALGGAGVRRLVLISSLSVYGYAALPDGAQLDETTPTEHDLSGRDAYCRAKLEQEAIALNAAQTRGLLVTSLRPGVIYGPGRLWSARIGFSVGPLTVLLGGNAAIPLAYVEHCADAAVLAAERGAVASDVYVEADAAGRLGGFEAINVIDDAPPTQRQYVGLLNRGACGRPGYLPSLPWSGLKKLASAVGLLGMIAPGAVAGLPQLFRPASMHARIKPLRYSNCRLRDRLGWRPAAGIQEAIEASCKSD